MLHIINNTHEMLEFIKSKENDFQSMEDWQNWFGFELKWDEETGEVLESIDDYASRGGAFDNIPCYDEYPVVVAYIQDGSFNRYQLDIEVYDWVSIK